MNRKQRRHPGKARKAALALLVAGTLVAGSGGGIPAAQAESLDTLAVANDLLYIQGGGGGGGAGSSGDGGGGGGGYVAYLDNSNPLLPAMNAYAFGGGGEGVPGGGPATFSIGGSIGGGNGSGALPGAGGSAGSFAACEGDSTKIPGGAVINATTESGVPASSAGTIPYATSITVGKGIDGQSSATSGGAGGKASVNTTNATYDTLYVIGGEGGEDVVIDPTTTHYGGQGGAAALYNTGTLNVKNIVLGITPSVAPSPGTVSLSTDTLSVGVGYTCTVAGSTPPAVSIGNYEFDITGALNGSTLLSNATGSMQPLPGNVPVTISGVNTSLAIGDAITLMTWVDGTGNYPQSVDGGGYTFTVDVVGPPTALSLVATVESLYVVHGLNWDFGTWKESGTINASIIANLMNGQSQNFKGLYSGKLADPTKLVDPSFYTAMDGSTIITLSEAYLMSLNPGTYTFRAQFVDGFALLTLIIPLVPMPATGDSAPLWATVLAIAAAGILGTTLGIARHRRKREIA